MGLEVFAGSGLGRTPAIGIRLRDWLPEHELLAYMEAILRVYNAYGRRDNLYKARLKILVQALGRDAFAEKVEAEFEAVPKERYRSRACLLPKWPTTWDSRRRRILSPPSGGRWA